MSAPVFLFYSSPGGLISKPGMGLGGLLFLLFTYSQIDQLLYSFTSLSENLNCLEMRVQVAREVRRSQGETGFT